MVRASTPDKTLSSMAPDAIQRLSQERLSRAVADVADALTDQRTEVRRYHQSIQTLAEALDRLQDSWRLYDDALARIEIARLGRRSRRLARIMDI